MYLFFFLQNLVKYLNTLLSFLKGADKFEAKVNIEVQWTTEPVIAAIERNGGVITTAFYDIQTLYIMRDVKKFFEKGQDSVFLV